jgi:hypothetical protein
MTDPRIDAIVSGLSLHLTDPESPALKDADLGLPNPTPLIPCGDGDKPLDMAEVYAAMQRAGWKGPSEETPPND